MSDVSKLKRQQDKAKSAVEARRAELDTAIFAHAQAVMEHSVISERLEQAEAMAEVLGRRSGKSAKEQA